MSEEKHGKYSTHSGTKRKVTEYYPERRKFQRATRQVAAPIVTNHDIRRMAYNRNVKSKKRRFSRSRNASTRYRKRGTRFGRRNRWGKRNVRRRGRRFRGGGKNKFRKAIINAVTPLDSLTFQRGDVFVVAGSTANNWTCGYRCMGLGSNNNDPQGVQDPGIMCAIAQLIVNRLGLSPPYSIAFQLQKGSIIHRLTNDSNRSVSIKAYRCRVRRDLPNVAPFNTTTDSVLTILGRGFADNGIDNTQRGANNGGLLRTDLTPYDSSLFTQTFKIVGTRSLTLGAGRNARFGIYVKRPTTIRPNRYLQMSATTSTYDNSVFIINWVRGEEFWLFKFMQNAIANNNADTTNIASSTIRVNMLTTVNVDYKYLNNLLPTITYGTSNNIALAGTVNNMPTYITGTGSIAAATT